ncbi:MAG: maleylacetoacetate isomerase [Xanthomonadaceae bacterium]|nr:maleylacetoacetate isomerase [Xanthomonadaceae bacterium]
MRLHTYYRSTAAWRVRIALQLKGVAYDAVPVHLLRDGGEQRTDTYRALNPQQLVPLLTDGDERISQSLAIIEYLDETHPEPPLLPRSPAGRARVRALAQVVACDMHPLNNLRVQQYLAAEFGADDGTKQRWMHQWLAAGFDALERMLADDLRTGAYCHGDTPTLADLCLVPQVYSARRFSFDLAPYPTVVRIDAHCAEQPAFAAAAPDAQPDAE